MKRARKRCFISYRIYNAGNDELIRQGNATFIDGRRNMVTNVLIESFKQHIKESYKYTNVYVEILEIN